jgi:hypothetical protein
MVAPEAQFAESPVKPALLARRGYHAGIEITLKRQIVRAGGTGARQTEDSREDNPFGGLHVTK